MSTKSKTNITIAFFIFCLIFCSGCGNKEISKEVSKKASTNITVYITKTGECYHKAKCTCLRKSKIEKNLAEANKNYRACQICHPPIIKKEER